MTTRNEQIARDIRNQINSQAAWLRIAEQSGAPVAEVRALKRNIVDLEVQLTELPLD